MKKYWWFWIVLFAFFSCNSGDVLFEENLSLENALWKSNNMATFDFTIKDTISYYDILVNLRNNDSYEYSNLYLFVSIDFPNGKKHIDTLNAILADPTGRWVGSGIGDIYDNQFILVDNLAFPISGEYQVNVVHAMRKKDLQGIENIGLKVQKHH